LKISTKLNKGGGLTMDLHKHPTIVYMAMILLGIVLWSSIAPLFGYLMVAAGVVLIFIGPD